MLSPFLAFRSDYVCELTNLPLADLQSRGVKVLAFDLDHTLAHARSRQLSDYTVSYMQQVQASGFKLFLASNAMSDITNIGTTIQAEIIQATWFSRKPFDNYYRRLICATGVSAGEIAMIGDRKITDILGGNRAGLVTIRIKRHPKP